MSTEILDRYGGFETNNPERIMEALRKHGYGTYRVILHPECSFNLEGISREHPSPVFKVEKRKDSRNRIEERMICGTYRRHNDLSEESMSLEILHDLDAIIPYEAMAQIGKVAEIPV